MQFKISADKGSFYRFIFIIYISLFVLFIAFFIPYNDITGVLIPFFLGLASIAYGEQVAEVKKYELKETYEAKQIASFNLIVGKFLQLLGLILIVVSIVRIAI
ncbi:MAG: hypothetical protein ACQESE_01815 [Nanobdellota archaeon]